MIRPNRMSAVPNESKPDSLAETTDEYSKAKDSLLRARESLRVAEIGFKVAKTALLDEICGHPHLTPMQQKVLELIRERKSNKEISQILNIGERTVKFHVTSILAKFHVGSRYEL